MGELTEYELKICDVAGPFDWETSVSVSSCNEFVHLFTAVFPVPSKD